MDSFLDFLREAQGPWQLWLLFIISALEYIFPPVPGDTVVVAGSLLVVAGVWPLDRVFLVVLAGGLVGSVGQYAMGRLLRDEHGSLRGAHIIEKMGGRGSARKFLDAFRKYGLWLLVFNRMIPGLRTVALLMAGASALPPVQTIALGFVSHTLWSAFLVALGLTIGHNWGLIQEVLEVYWVVVGVAVVVGILVALRIRRRNKWKNADE